MQATWERLYYLGEKIRELPYSQLKRHHHHAYPTLKGWPKWKSFKETWPSTWASIKWRPLSSYSRHHWAALLGLASRFCTTAVTVLNWGWNASRPSDVVRDATAFNMKLGREASKVSLDLGDISDFFPSVDLQKFQFCIGEALRQLLVKMPEAKYF
jgi:hypothetical protein